MKESFILQFAVSLCSTAHIPRNSELLDPSSGVVYPGTTNEHVTAANVAPSSTPDCVAIQYERSGHPQLYLDCPLDHLVFPISRAESSLGRPSHAGADMLHVQSFPWQ